MVGRFQVMALLQAARATALEYPLDEAESFGLNRAIFYAAAKRGFKGSTSSKHPGEQHVLKESPGRSVTKTIQQDALGEEVYKPRRDELAKAWTALSKQARSL